MRETFQQFVARVNRYAYLADEHTGVNVMAKAVKLKKGAEFTFTSGAGAAQTKYPWDEWFSGDLLLLEQSEGTKDDKGTVKEITSKRDYEVDTDAMPAKLKTAARRRYKVVQISRRDADGNKLKDGLIIRARDMDADERAAEDLLRAEEKAARKEKGEANGDTAPTDASAPTQDANQPTS